MENLAHWNLQAVKARRKVDKKLSTDNCERLAFARCMVKIIEKELLIDVNAKGIK